MCFITAILKNLAKTHKKTSAIEYFSIRVLDIALKLLTERVISVTAFIFFGLLEFLSFWLVSQNSCFTENCGATGYY